MDITLPEPRTDRLREDRCWFDFDPPYFVEVTRPYGKRKGTIDTVGITLIYARFDEEGALLSASATGFRVKKDGELERNRYTFGYGWERETLYEPLKTWRAGR